MVEKYRPATDHRFCFVEPDCAPAGLYRCKKLAGDYLPGVLHPCGGGGVLKGGVFQKGGKRGGLGFPFWVFFSFFFWSFFFFSYLFWNFPPLFLFSQMARYFFLSLFF